MQSAHSHNRGFTLIELLVTMSIFVFMTLLVISKYGAFNQSTFLTNTAYDVALTVHTAQTFGLSVKGTDYTVSGNTNTQGFDTAYGVDIDTTANKSHFVFFADKNKNGLYDTASDDNLNDYNITHGAVISSMCVGTGPSDCSTIVPHVTLTFKRPNPDAIIYAYVSGSPTIEHYVQITLTASDGSNSRIVSIRQNGQINVGN